MTMTISSGLAIFVSLPGCSADDIDISATKDTLIIAGEMKPPNLPAVTGAVQRERDYGNFKRVFLLPAVVEPDKISATFKDGVLGIQLPLAEETKGRSIKVKVKTTKRTVSNRGEVVIPMPGSAASFFS